MKLRDFQNKAVNEVSLEWEKGNQNILLVAPTGAGKTVMFGNIIANTTDRVVAVAHRKELVSQMSLTLCRHNVRHNIIASRQTIGMIIKLHMRHFKKSYYDPNSVRSVSSVDTLIRMSEAPWMKQVRLWVMDEAHHVLRGNKWGQAVAMFPNAKGLGVTATPGRADGRGLGRHASGVFDVMVCTPNMRDLINAGFLCEYKIYAPTTHMDLMQVAISAGGDYSPKALANVVHDSTIVGDVVRSYQQFTPGKVGVTFAVNVQEAERIAEAYRTAGVPALAVSALTPDIERDNAISQLASGELKQLVNVDLFGEGFDLPAIEVVSMARPSQSFPLITQQFGRALRLKDGKTHGTIIDHVGNIMRHGLPDGAIEHSLNDKVRTSRGASSSTITTRTCPECLFVYERVFGLKCPDCGFVYEPPIRTIDTVDGVIGELPPELLAKLRGEIDKPVTYPYNANELIVRSIDKRHREKIEAREQLVHAMQVWGAYAVQSGDTLEQAQRRFYLKFGIDVLSAQTLTRSEMVELWNRITAI